MHHTLCKCQKTLHASKVHRKHVITIVNLDQTRMSLAALIVGGTKPGGSNTALRT